VRLYINFKNSKFEKGEYKKRSMKNATNPLYGAKLDETTFPKTLLNYDEVFTELQVLGEGSRGIVFKVKNNFTGAIYALKHLSEGIELSAQDVIDEISINARFSKYPNCNDKDFLCYYDNFMTVDIDEALNTEGEKIIYEYEHFYIIYEYVEGIKLADYLVNEQFSIGDLYNFTEWILRVVKTLHKALYTHGDIKPDNIIVLTDNGKPTGKYKLIDFGSSTDLEYPRQLQYSDPIMEKMNRQNRRRRLDMYQVGRILFYLIMSDVPSKDNLIALDFPDECYKELVNRLITPSSTITAEGAHKTFTSECKH
jgi:serine/threonine protein kinase